MAKMTPTEQLHQQMIFNLVARVEAAEKLACAAIAILCELQTGAATQTQSNLDRLFSQFAQQPIGSSQGETPVHLSNWLKNREQEHLDSDRKKINALIEDFAFFPKAAGTNQ